MDKQHVLLLSYWPLLDHRKFVTKPGQTFDPDTLKGVELPDVHVDACLWTMDKEDGQPVLAPVLIVENAKKIVYHLMEWTEGQPLDWFKLVVADNGHNYLVALFPNIDRSIARWRLGYKLTHDGQEPPDNYEFNIIFRPLVFGAGISESYRNVKKLLRGKPMNFGLLDRDNFDIAKPFAAEQSKIINLGKYALADPTPIKGWIDGYLEDLQPPPTGAFSMVNSAVNLE